MTEATLLILAGGLGSRYKGKKQIDPMGPAGECLMEYSIYDAARAGFTQLVLIINDYFNDTTKEYFIKIAKTAGLQLDFVVQKLDSFVPEEHRTKLDNRLKPWGTAHATYVARDVIKNPFVVINADDYYNKHAFKKAFDLIRQGKIAEGQYGMVAYPLSGTMSDNGTVSRGVCTIKDGFLKTVVEHTKIQKEDDKIVGLNGQDVPTQLASDTLVSMNFWVLDPSIFRVLQRKFDLFLSDLKTETTEWYIPFVIDEMIHEDDLDVVVEVSKDRWFGVTYPADKPGVVQSLQNMVEKGLYPTPLWQVESSVKISAKEDMDEELN